MTVMMCQNVSNIFKGCHVRKKMIIVGFWYLFCILISWAIPLDGNDNIIILQEKIYFFLPFFGNTFIFYTYFLNLNRYLICMNFLIFVIILLVIYEAFHGQTCVISLFLPLQCLDFFCYFIIFIVYCDSEYSFLLQQNETKKNAYFFIFMIFFIINLIIKGYFINITRNYYSKFIKPSLQKYLDEVVIDDPQFSKSSKNSSSYHIITHQKHEFNPLTVSDV